MCKKITALLLVMLSVIFVGCGNTGKEIREINLSVAASLLEPMTKIAEIYEKDNNVKININSGGSGTLKKQISEGADIGLFFSANEKFVDDLIIEGLVEKDKKLSPITNSLVLIKYKDAKEEISNINELTNLKGNIAIGEVTTVPAGEYAKEALTSLGIWTEVEDNIIYGKDVTAVRTYVERGEVEYGFIYKSDAIALESSSILEVVDPSLHTEINYALAPIEGYEYSEDCDEIIELILSKEGKAILEEYGFGVRE